MRTASLMSWLVRKKKRTLTIGYKRKKADPTAAITPLHFYVKVQNKQRGQKRKNQKLIKLGKLL